VTRGSGKLGLRNIGPVGEGWLAEIEVHTAADLRAMGAVEAWRRLRFFIGPHVNLMALIALEAALLDIHWRDLPVARRAELKALSDAERAARV
jgi:DNA transformation protein and related proteins